VRSGRSTDGRPDRGAILLSGRAVDVVQGSVVDRKRRLQVCPNGPFLGPTVLLLCVLLKAVASHLFETDSWRTSAEGAGLAPHR
jgi:hypothetical protein